MPTSNQYGLQNAVWYDEQGSLSWWLRTDQQNNIAITTMYFVADFSTYLGPWMHMTFGSMNNRYHTGSFTGGWNLNPSSTYINNMEYGIVGGGQQIKAGSATCNFTNILNDMKQLLNGILVEMTDEQIAEYNARKPSDDKILSHDGNQLDHKEIIY